MRYASRKDETKIPNNKHLITNRTKIVRVLFFFIMV